MGAKTERAVVQGKQLVAPRAAERIVLTLPHGLVERLTDVAEKKGLTRAAYIRMVLTDHLATESMEEVDRQLWELAKRAEKARPDRR
jgi:predicted DNA-binding protein